MLNNGLTESVVHFDMHLAPSCSRDILGSIQKKLNTMILKYDERVNGIILAYSDIKLASNKARILKDCPFMQLSFYCRVLSFSPQSGDMVQAKVKKQSQDYIALTVMGMVNAVIPARQIDRYRWDADASCWVSDEDNEVQIQVGTLLSFSITNVKASSGNLSIVGTIKTEATVKPKKVKHKHKHKRVKDEQLA
ncbi:hypothetical protein MIR68_008839 [Amoeboaphelidium protococcarum]|nr:hypothetical protein MIR68_008839 [Amoeboaphelidium protococcarum]